MYVLNRLGFLSAFVYQVLLYYLRAKKLFKFMWGKLEHGWVKDRAGKSRGFEVVKGTSGMSIVLR